MPYKMMTNLHKIVAVDGAQDCFKDGASQQSGT